MKHICRIWQRRNIF